MLQVSTYTSDDTALNSKQRSKKRWRCWINAGSRFWPWCFWLWTTWQCHVW